MKILMVILTPLFLHANAVVATGGEGGRDSQPHTLYYGVAEHPSLRGSTRDLISVALGIAKAAAPRGITIKEGNRENFDFIIEVTTSEVSAQQQHAEIKRYSKINGDAFSILFSEIPDSPIVVRVLWDKAMFEMGPDGRWRERPDALTRLAVLLGHEIYGNVRYFKKNRHYLSSEEMLNDKAKQKKANLDSEINAFSEGVAFIKRVIENLSIHFTEKMQNDFGTALQREEAALANYRNQNDWAKSKVTTLEVMCKAVLGR